MFQPQLYRCCALVAALATLASLVSARSAIAQEPQVATVLVLIDTTDYPEADDVWFADEAVGILLHGNDLGGSAGGKSCSVPGFEGGYTPTDARLVTKHGGRILCQVYVKADPGALLPAHGFLPVAHFQDVQFFILVDTANNLSENANGGYAGFFVTVGL
jgi:hypothetical protein